jgi:hypothetical protein
MPTMASLEGRYARCLGADVDLELDVGDARQDGPEIEVGGRGLVAVAEDTSVERADFLGHVFGTEPCRCVPVATDAGSGLCLRNGLDWQGAMILLKPPTAGLLPALLSVGERPIASDGEVQF